jgi:WKF domain
MPSAIDSASAVRMPAWKRLGLKLKSAQDIPESPPVNPKRKRLDEVEEASSLKKSKPSPEPHSISTVDQVTPEPARKKSVTFTPETKNEDGDSIKALFSAWVAEHKNKDDLSTPVFQTPQASTVEETFDTTLDEKERRVKRVKTLKQGKTESKDPPKAKDLKKAKKKKEIDHLASHSASTEAEEESLKSTEQSKTKKARKPRTAKGPANPALPEKPFLAYLKQYSESRETWKFNKNHQSHLLKHLFDIDIVPSNYAHYVYEYVKGLQGGVRTRLRDTAIAIKVKDQEEPFPADMENSEQRKRVYDVAMNEYVTTMMAADVGPNVGYEGVLLGLSDAAMPTRVAKRKRVERILAVLGSGEGEVIGTGEKEVVIADDESQKRLRMNDGSSQKVVRKRKQRTMVVDDESSSEEDSSDSEEGSSEESTTQRDDPEDTSSNSSSSSSGSEGSDSEDGSEEESESENE